MTLKRKTPLRPKKALKAKKPCPTVEQMMSSGLLARGSTFTSKPKRLAPRKKKVGVKTQMAFFQEIWAERDHVSEVSGQWLGDDLDVRTMSHLLPKGAYRRYKFDPRNIVLLTADEHELWHLKGPDFLRQFDSWKPVCDLYFELRDEANGLN
jgi:hypothetical protein